MYAVVSSENGYVESTHRTVGEAIAACQKAEAKDGWCRTVYENGMPVADGDGEYPQEARTPYQRSLDCRDG